MRRKISLVAALFVLLFFSLSTAGRCGLERMVNFGITLPLGESWRVLSLTGSLRLSQGKVGPHMPYLELGGELLAGSRSLNADAGFAFVLREQFWAVRRPGVEEWKSRWGGV